MIINNIEFDIKDVENTIRYVPILSQQHTYQQMYMNQGIKITAETSTDNWMSLEKWIEDLMSREKKYKYDFTCNTVRFGGVYPTDYIFQQHNILVTFSADYFKGDLELFKIQRLRKEKIKQIEKNIDK